MVHMPFITLCFAQKMQLEMLEYVGYSPNEKAKELMDPEVTSDETYYPSEELSIIRTL